MSVWAWRLLFAVGMVFAFWIEVRPIGVPIYITMPALVLFGYLVGGMTIRREPKPLVKHPACYAPACLRGGKCTGPCRNDP